MFQRIRELINNLVHCRWHEQPDGPGHAHAQTGTGQPSTEAEAPTGDEAEAPTGTQPPAGPSNLPTTRRTVQSTTQPLAGPSNLPSYPPQPQRIVEAQPDEESRSQSRAVRYIRRKDATT
jgi:hypothetical protein